MQEALLPPAHPELHSGFAPKPLGFGDRRLSSLSSPNLLTNGDDLFYGCYSPFGPSGGGLSSPSPRATSLSHRSSSSDSLVDDGHGTAVTEHRLHLARLALQFQEVANGYQLCLSHLADAADEAAALRVENAELRVANNDLACRIAMLGRKQGSAIALADELRCLRLGEEQTMPAPPTPTGPAVQARLPGSAAEEHAVLPKSISIRSTSYLKMNQSGKHRVSKPVNVGSQRVFVGMDGASAVGEEQKGGEKKDQLTSGLEFEVFNQGMFKTELCNKWEETGSCPYGDQCQFAHGVGELRPVIRHPRYRTEVCRMVLAGGVCPYGQRCHFRHSIIPADRLLLRQRCSSPTATLSLPASLPSV